MKLVFVLFVLAIFASDNDRTCASAQIQDVVHKFRKCAAAVAIELNDCMVDLWTDFRPSFVAGIPALNLSTIDPLRIPLIELPAQDLIKGRARVEDVTATGLRNYEVRAANVDVAARTVVLNMFIPTLIIEGNYTMDAEAFLMPVKGDGKLLVKLTGVDNVVRMLVSRNNSDSKATSTSANSTLSLFKLDMSFDAKNITIRLDNLLGGGDVSVVVNKFLNANARDVVLGPLQPLLSETLSQLLRKYAAAVIQVIPANILD